MVWILLLWHRNKTLNRANFLERPFTVGREEGPGGSGIDFLLASMKSITLPDVEGRRFRFSSWLPLSLLLLDRFETEPLMSF